MSGKYEHVKNIRKRMKLFSIKAMGDSCQICGYSECVPALEFHHIDPKEKDFDFRSIKSWESLNAELEKCILLCCRCHREVHYGVVGLPEYYHRLDKELMESLRRIHNENALALGVLTKETKLVDADETLRGEITNLIIEGLSIREIANKLEMTPSRTRGILVRLGLQTKFSSERGRSKVDKKLQIPRRKFNCDENELRDLINSGMPLTRIGVMFGVSDNAVRKRCKVLGIDIPKRKGQ